MAILFTDVVGSTELAARLGAEQADQLRQAHFALLRAVIAEHAGTEVKNLGDGLIVAFPAASDAVAAAVAAQQALEHDNRQADEPIGMRVGLAAGEATLEGGDYFGTPVIEAARLCAVAATGQILVTGLARAVAGTRGGHGFAPLGQMTLKGLPDPVEVYEAGWEPVVDVGPPLPPRLATDPAALFVGRTAERAVLETAWKSAGQGSRQVVFLAGEPGIGKTRLATEMALAAHAEGATVLLGSCAEDLAVPYEPFVEALRHLAGGLSDAALAEHLGGCGADLTRLLPELAVRLPGLASPQGSEAEAERYALFAAATGFLASVSRSRPVFLVLDDVHWATTPTVLMLRHLLRSVQPMELLVICTYRDTDVGRGHPLVDLLADLRRDDAGVARVVLRGLSDAESIALMEGLAGHEFSGVNLEAAQAVHSEADGSPFFMRELLRHLIESGALVRDGDGWTYRGDPAALGIPESVREVIGRRLGRLPEATERLLSWGAVAGREFDVEILVALAGESRRRVVEMLEPACRANLVREVADAPGRFAFAHGLIRHTVYSELGPAQRVEAHRAVAEALEALGGELSSLAHHWAEATPATSVRGGDVAKAAGYAEAAARRAMASLAYEEAVHHFAAALRHVDPTRRLDLMIDLGEAQRCAGDPTHRDTLLTAGRLAHQARDAASAAHAALANQRGVFARMGAVDVDRVTALEAAVAAVGDAPTAVRARLLAALATEVHYEGQGRGLVLAQDALAVARQSGDAATLAESLAALWLAAWGTDDHGIRVELSAELSILARGLGSRVLAFRAAVAAFHTAIENSDLAGADQALADCERIAGELGQPTLAWRVTHLHMLRATAVGSLVEVEHWSAEAARLGAASGQPDGLPLSSGAPAMMRILQGCPAQALHILEPVIAQFPGATVFPAIQAWAFAEDGRIDEAAAILDRLFGSTDFDRVPRDHHRPLTLCALSRVCHRLQDETMAQELYQALIPFRSVTVTGQTTWLGPAAYDLGLLATMLGRYDEADRLFADALAAQQRLPAQVAALHTRLGWAGMLLRRGDAVDAARARVLLDVARADALEADLVDLLPRIDALLGGAPSRRA